MTACLLPEPGLDPTGVNGAAPLAPTAVARDRRMQVLVVEDDPVQALILTLMLERLAVVTTLVTNGAQAIGAVQAGAFGLVLMDCLMPVCDGVEATRAIRAWERAQGHAHVPIVAVTASAMVSERHRYTEAGMDDIMPKPITAQAVADLVARHTPIAEVLP